MFIAAHLSASARPARGFLLRRLALSSAVAALLAAQPAVAALGPVTRVSQNADQHTVLPGETLSHIALRNDTTVSALVKLNDLRNADHIRIGQVLRLSKAEAVTAPPAPTIVAAGQTHTVTRGQTLSGIAARYDVTQSSLQGANGITNANLIRIGDRLTIPGADAPVPAAPVTPAPETNVAGVHVVERGDVLGVIASKYGVSVRAIVSENDLRNANHIVVGQALVIPGRAPSLDGTSCPVDGVSFVNDFGYVKPSGSVHAGIDLFATRGAAFRAPTDGVAHQEQGPVGGYQIRFEGIDGVTWYGTHLDGYSDVRGGVLAGTVLGYVGTTGNAAATSPHVHFEMIVDGVAENPYPWLVLRCR